MKKILLILIMIILTGCANAPDILKRIEISDTKCLIEREINTHGGFLGDGESFVKLSCANLSESNLSSNWKKTPLTNEISDAMNMIICDNSKCCNSYERYNIPMVEEGYYFFLDRHSASTNKYDASNINNRSSYNFSLAILDIKHKMVYYYELDT